MRVMTNEENQYISKNDSVSQFPAVRLDEEWSLPRDVLLIIFSFLLRTDISKLSLVSKSTHEFLKQIKPTLQAKLAPYDRCYQLNELGSKSITLEKLWEHWNGDSQIFQRLCSVRSLAYLYEPRNEITDKFAKELALLTYSSITLNGQVSIYDQKHQVTQIKQSFLLNPYIKDLVMLALMIEVYHRNNDFVVSEESGKVIRVSTLTAYLCGSLMYPGQYFGCVFNQPPLIIDHDQSKICLDLLELSKEHLFMRNMKCEELFCNFLKRYLPLDSFELLKKFHIIDNTNKYTYPFRNINIFKPILINLYIDPKFVSRVLPSIIIENPISFDMHSLQKLSLMPRFYLEKINSLGNESISILINEFDCINFAKQLNRFNNVPGASIYNDAIKYALGMPKEFRKYLFDCIFKMDHAKLQEKINNVYSLTSLLVKPQFQSIILILSLMSKLFNLEITRLIKFINNVFCNDVSRINLIHDFMSLNEEVICCFIIENFEIFLTGLSYKALQKSIEFFKKHFSPNLLFLIRNKYVSILDLFKLSEAQIILFEAIIETIPQEQFTKDDTQEIVTVVKKLLYNKNRALFRDPKLLLSKLTQDSPISAKQIVMLLQSPLLNLVITCPEYTTLFNLIGLEKLNYCDAHVQVINGQKFKIFIESLKKDALEKYQTVMLIIKESCVANQEFLIAKKIHEYLSPIQIMEPAKYTNSPLLTNSIFANTKKHARDSESDDPDLEKLQKLFKRAEQDHRLRKIILSSGEKYLKEKDSTDNKFASNDEEAGNQFSQIHPANK